VKDNRLSKIKIKKYVFVQYTEDPGVDGRIILKWIFKKWDGGGMAWIDMAQDRDRWRALVSAVMDLRVP
jgi:hypothetical protein